MKRFQDYRPSRAMTAAIEAVRRAREKLARNAEQDARQQVARTGGNADPMGGQEKTGVEECGGAVGLGQSQEGNGR
jgi:hypothetical protein